MQKSLKFLKDLKANWKTNLIDGALLLISATFFYLFLADFSNNSELMGEVATVTRGSMERKKLASSSFESVTLGDRLYHRDLIWSGPKQTGMITFDDGTDLEVSENTFFVIRRLPGKKNGSKRIEVFKGDVKVADKLKRNSVEIEKVTEGDAKLVPVPIASATPVAAPKPKVAPPKPVIPTPAPVPSKVPAPELLDKLGKSLEVGVLPTPDSLLLLLNAKQKTSKIKFFWPTAIEGTIEITREVDQSVVKRPIKSEHTSLAVSLKAGSMFHWKIVKSDGTLVHGPYRFLLDYFSKNNFNQSLNKGPKPKIELIFDGAE